MILEIIGLLTLKSIIKDAEKCINELEDISDELYILRNETNEK